MLRSSAFHTPTATPRAKPLRWWPGCAGNKPTHIGQKNTLRSTMRKPFQDSTSYAARIHPHARIHCMLLLRQRLWLRGGIGRMRQWGSRRERMHAWAWSLVWELGHQCAAQGPTASIIWSAAASHLHEVRERLPKQIVNRSTNGVTRVISMLRIKFLGLSGRLNRWPGIPEGIRVYICARVVNK